MQTNFENKLDSVISRFVDGHTNINQLKHDLSCEKEKSNRLQSDLTLQVRERNIEVDELNETIASLQGKISTVKKINDQLRASNMCIKLETAINIKPNHIDEKSVSFNYNSCRTKLAISKQSQTEYQDHNDSLSLVLNDKQNGYTRQRFYQNNNANQFNYNNNQQQPIPTRITTRKRVKNVGRKSNSKRNECKTICTDYCKSNISKPYERRKFEMGIMEEITRIFVPVMGKRQNRVVPILLLGNRAMSAEKDANSPSRDTKNTERTRSVNFNLIYVNCTREQKTYFMPINFCLLNTRSINRKELFINDYVSENDIDILLIMNFLLLKSAQRGITFITLQGKMHEVEELVS
jgi:hypothetical protein